MGDVVSMLDRLPAGALACPGCGGEWWTASVRVTTTADPRVTGISSALICGGCGLGHDLPGPHTVAPDLAAHR